MRYLKALIKNIPVIGYVIRFIIALVLLPRTLSRLHHQLLKAHKDIEELRRNSFSANLKVVELNEEVMRLKTQTKAKNKRS